MIQSGSIDMKAMSIRGDFIVNGVKFSAEKELPKLKDYVDCRMFIKSFDSKVSVGTLTLLSTVSKDVMYKVYDGAEIVVETHDFTKVLVPQNDKSPPCP